MYVFIIEQIQLKLISKFFNKLKNPCFRLIFGPFSQFSGKNVFPENPDLSRLTSYRFLALHQNLEKTNDTILRKRPDRRKGEQDGQKDRQTLFYRTYLATARGPKNIELVLIFWKTYKRAQSSHIRQKNGRKPQ